MTEPSSPDSQQLLMTLVQATAELVQLNKRYSQKIDTVEGKVDTFDLKLDTVAVKVGIFDNKLDTVETNVAAFETKLGTFDAKFDAKIEAIADQIGKLSESMTAFRLDLDDIKETTRQQAEPAKAQAKSVSQLIALLGKNKVLHQARSRSVTMYFLANTYDRGFSPFT